MKFSELIDVGELQGLCQSFTDLTGAVTAVLDLEGNILIATGWQDICTCYHRVHPVTALRCRESDIVLAARLEKTESYCVYRCKNGLVDVAMPIKVGGEHVANLFTGQFFFKMPDKELFIRQAAEFGFDKTAYLGALSRVPVFSERQVELMVALLSRLSRMVGEMGFERKGLEEINLKLLHEIDKHRLAEEKFSRIVHTCPDAVYIVGPDGAVSEMNEAFSQMSGFSRGEVIGKATSDLGIWVDLQDRDSLAEGIKSYGEVLNQEIRFRCKDGNILHCLHSARVIDINAEKCLLSFIRDITDRKLTEMLQAAVYRISEAAVSSGSLEALYGNVHKIIGELVPATNFYIAIYDEHENIIHFPYHVDEYDSECPSRFFADGLAEYVIRTGAPLLADDQRLMEMAASGEAVTIGISGTGWLGVPLKASGGKILGVMAVQTYTDGNRYTEKHIEILCVISNQVSLAIERKWAEEKLKYVSSHDALTGIYNRAFFEEEFARLKETKETVVALILCDINGMKLVNDTLGHAAGDKLLITAAKIIQSAVCGGDVVARIGGDEFAIILSQANSRETEAVCEQIKANIAEYNRTATAVTLSISFGYAVKNIKKVSVEELFKEADDYMYRDKMHRANSVRSSMVQTAMKLLAARDFITEEHAERLQKLAADLARKLGLPEQRIADIRLLAKFHDIGKVGIPDRILLKPGRLTPEERKEMRRHAEIGCRIAQASTDLSPIADWILKHHEWWNGWGYPLGLREEEIPLECRIMAIADAYDAMTSDRPYRKAMSKQKAIDELQRQAGIQFDPKMVADFVATVQTGIGNFMCKSL